MTIFVERKGGTIVGVYAARQSGYAEEELADDHPDVVAFRKQADEALKPTNEQQRLVAYTIMSDPLGMEFLAELASKEGTPKALAFVQARERVKADHPKKKEA